MCDHDDPAVVFFNNAHPPGMPGTHVLIVGVGKYKYGRGPEASAVAGDLPQLTSPPISARAIADWFITSFKKQDKPLVSVSLLISEENPTVYHSPGCPGAETKRPLPATLEKVKSAARQWADRLSTNPDNMSVFYFCGHGISRGQDAALLLEDFGQPAAAYEGAIDVNVLRGTLKNSPAIQQAYLFDCCRTNADDIYQHEPAIGSRVLSIPFSTRGHSIPPQQFVLFPTLDGEQAFGIRGDVSVFSKSIIDALGFAAADCSTGVWRTTTAGLLNAVDQLVRVRVPRRFTMRSKPNALDATSFDFNDIDEPTVARSFVTISDLNLWGKVEFECLDPAGVAAPQRLHSKHSPTETCCTFLLSEGRWRFAASLLNPTPNIQAHERTLRVPVAYVTLQVTTP